MALQLSEQRRESILSLNLMVGRSLCLLICSLVLTITAFAQNGLDTSFASGGISTVNAFDQTDNIYALNVNQSDGKIIAIGSTCNYFGGGSTAQGCSAVVIRYSPNGSLDSSFGVNGVFEYNNALYPFLIVTSGLVQPDGKIVMLATNGGGIQVFRVNADGSRDTGFGNNGQFLMSASNSNPANQQISSVVLQPDGKLVLGCDDPTATMVRINANGTLDNSFGPNGNGLVSVASSAFKAMTRQADGKLLLEFLSGGNMNVARYSSEGVLETAFGVGGVATADFGGTDTPRALTVQSDGKIVAAGSTGFTEFGQPAKNFAMARFTSAGQLDATFGAGGKLTFDFSRRTLEEWRAVVQEANGNIVAAGFPNLGLVRIGPTGAILGKIDNDLRHQPYAIGGTVNALALQPDGRILAAGENGSVIQVARFNTVTHLNNATIKFDMDGDRHAEIAAYTPAPQSYWFGYFTSQLVLNGPYRMAQPFGVTEDIIVPADYTGDGITDFAVFRPSTGTWYNSYSPEVDPNTNYQGVQWGMSGDIPAPGDFDGDGVFDRAVFRPSSGDWYVLNSTGGYTALHWGQNGDRPMPADYDGDGKSDIAVVRDQGGFLYWYILQSGSNSLMALQWGLSSDKCIATDFTGDGRAEISAFRPAEATWYMLSNYSIYTVTQYGLGGDLPVPADYDYDGKADFAIFRPSNATFYYRDSADGENHITNYGVGTDKPIATAYIR